MYEYVGEVIGPAPFARKMKEYANEGIKHFYFMALDKEVVRFQDHHVPLRLLCCRRRRAQELRLTTILCLPRLENSSSTRPRRVARAAS